MRQREGRAVRQAELQQAQKRRQQRRRIIIGAVVVIVILGVLYISNRGGSSKKTNVSSGSTTTAAPAKITGDTPCPKADGSSPRTTSFTKAPPMCIDTNKNYTATMVTDAGTIKIKLDPKKAPKTVNNFVVLSRYHFYDGTIFHRVIPGFVDQGGDPEGTGQGGPGYKFADELPKAGEYKVGSLAMANSGPDTNGSQFFIIVGAQGAGLQPNYSLFGEVTDGIDVAHKIENDGSADGTPKVTHKITTVTIEES
jgi:cyclophilin family peptidyl-prolyl cis-trans isomerase